MDTNMFSQLRSVASIVDKRLPELKESVNEKQQFSAVVAHNKILSIRREVKELKNSAQNELDKLQEITNSLFEMSSLGETFIEKLQLNVSNSSQFLQQYGYVPNSALSQKSTESVEQEAETSDKVEENNQNAVPEPSTPLQTKTPAYKQRTPQLEDFGLSEATLRGHIEYYKKPEDTRGNQKAGEPSAIPSIFQHDGFLCTPSLFPSHSNKAMSEEHASLASPVLPQFTHEDDSNPESAMKPVKLGFACESPGAQEPQEPELTYSLEALQEMTGMYRINLKEPDTSKPETSKPETFKLETSRLETSKPFVSLTDNKENTTPTEPELLSERVAKIKKDAIADPNSSVKPRHLYGEMPESPKFLMKYDFLAK